MKNEFLLQSLAGFLTVIIFGSVILLFGYLVRRDRYQASGFELISDRVRDEVAPRKVTAFIPKNDLRIETNKYLKYWGWVVIAETNRSVSTQWFRADGFLNREGEIDYIREVRFFLSPPEVFKKSSFETNLLKSKN